MPLWISIRSRRSTNCAPNLNALPKGYVDLAQLQYINGVINYMDVLDAQRGYFDAQIGVSNAIRDELICHGKCL